MLPASGLPLQLSSRIFATVALKTDAVAAFVHQTSFAIVRRTSGGAGTIIPAEELPAILTEFDASATRGFLTALKQGELHQHRYDSAEGDYRLTPDGLPQACVSQRSLAATYDPVSPELKTPWDRKIASDVALTIAGAYLVSLPTISVAVFEEALRRLYGDSRPELMDMLWIHASSGELDGGRITEAVHLTKNTPQRERSAGGSPQSSRFPYLPLEYDRQGWTIDERYVVGPRITKERVLEVMREVSWNIRFWSGSDKENRRPKRPSRKTIQKPLTTTPAPTPPKIPKTDSSRVISTSLMDPQEVWKIPKKGIILAMTQPDISVESLAQISEPLFQRAIEWSLGVRFPAEGERVAFTAGAGFARRGRLRDCLLVCPQIPLSRSGSSFPKVWMEYRNGSWIILNAEARGQGALELINAVLSIPHWKITHDGNDLSDGSYPAIVSPPETDKT